MTEKPQNYNPRLNDLADVWQKNHMTHLSSLRKWKAFNCRKRYLKQN